MQWVLNFMVFLFICLFCERRGEEKRGEGRGREKLGGKERRKNGKRVREEVKSVEEGLKQAWETILLTIALYLNLVPFFEKLQQQNILSNNLFSSKRKLYTCRETSRN